MEIINKYLKKNISKEMLTETIARNSKLSHTCIYEDYMYVHNHKA
jgi:hypothetical protein